MNVTFKMIGALVLATLFVATLPRRATAAEQAGPKPADKPKGSDKAPMGSPEFYPSSEYPIGFRGDGTGKYPGATPPTTWHRGEDGTRKNILWETKLPSYSFSMHLVIVDKLITRSDPYDLICLNKNTGKLLWIASHPPFVAIPDAEKKSNPAFKDIEGLVEQLQKLNDQFVAAGWSKDLYTKKYTLQKQINEKTTAINRTYALPPDKYVESWAGYTGQTPCTDGEFVYFTSADGVTACYDLNGNKKWAKYDQTLQYAEHGQYWSPGLMGGKLIVPIIPAKNAGSDLYDVFVVNKKTGEQLWRKTFDKGSGTYNVMPFKIGGKDTAIAFGVYFSVEDGNVLSPTERLQLGVPDGNRVYSINLDGQITWHQIDNNLKVTNLTPPKPEYPVLQLPKQNGDYWVAAPIYHDGLIYACSSMGMLAVVDPAKSEVVYSKQLSFDFKNPRSRKTFGMGLGASPAVGGKLIYLIDSAGCTIVMEPGREYKEIAKNNIDEIVPEGWEPSHWIGPHHEQTEASLVFDGSRIYIRGEQYIYCVGEK
jgi:outer membrane protein assembly factor BamB